MEQSRPRLLLAVLNLIGFAVVVVVNTLAATVPLGGKTTAQLSDQYPNLFVPSGLTFGIWGVIYILLGVYVVYGLVQKNSMGRIGILFLVTCAANAGWILSWQYEVLPLSMVCMVILLLALIAIYTRVGVGKAGAAPRERYLVHMPTSVYLGWITVATIANATALLVAYGWDRFGISEQAWAVAMIAIGALLGLVMLFLRGDIFYALVIDWAVLGILMKRTADTSVPAEAVVVASIVGLCLLTLGVLVQLVRQRVYRTGG